MVTINKVYYTDEQLLTSINFVFMSNTGKTGMAGNWLTFFLKIRTIGLQFYKEQEILENQPEASQIFRVYNIYNTAKVVYIAAPYSSPKLNLY